MAGLTARHAVSTLDSALAPVVGQQITLTATNAAKAGPRVDLLLARADTGEADIVVRGVVDGISRSARYSAGVFIVDDGAAAAWASRIWH